MGRKPMFFGEIASHKCACLLRLIMLLLVLSRMCVVFLALSINVSVLDEDNNRHVCNPCPQEEHILEGFDRCHQQGRQGILQVLSHTKVHGLQLSFGCPLSAADGRCAGCCVVWNSL